jgi:quinol monooxygenase YgiN
VWKSGFEVQSLGARRRCSQSGFSANARFFPALSRIRWAGGNIMGLLSIWAQLEAKPGKEKEVEEFLKSAQPLAEREAGTITWYAIKMGPGKYGIFDTFADENGRNAHLNGEIAKALFAKAKDLFAKAPDIAKPEILAAKSPRS